MRGGDAVVDGGVGDCGALDGGFGGWGLVFEVEGGTLMRGPLCQ